MASFLQIDGLTKSFGDLVLFQNITFGVAQGQKIGLIAPNGSGKTTLLNIIAGKEGYDSGSVVFRSDLRVGYLEQTPHFDDSLTVLEACHLSSDQAVQLKAKKILSQLQINEFDRLTGTLSGGQLKRLALANVLITEPELILLDEPTNHLDMEMIEWLESYFERSTISLLMVTHDRYFLDRVCTEIIEIEQKNLYRYQGNYSYYIEKRSERIAAKNSEIERANNLLRKELDWMRRMPQARATKAKYRIDAFYELEEKANQRTDNRQVRLNVKSSYIGSKIFEAVNVTKRFDDIKILHDFNYTFTRYEKLGITGNNGTGKSTFVKLLTGEIPPDNGHFDIGETVRFGYYSQEGLTFNDNEKVIDTVRKIAESITMGDGKTLTVSQFLNFFLFSPDKQHNYVGKLSGGEKRRLYLCTVLMQNPNFLILDEPTNDLDIVTLNILEEYLTNFKGCVIVISHDRYFMDKIVDHILVFHGNAEIQDFAGNYSQYRGSRGSRGNDERSENRGRLRTMSNKEEFFSQSEKNRGSREITVNVEKEQRKKLTYKEQREFETLEEEIGSLESEKNQLETELSIGNLSVNELRQKSIRIGEVIELIDEKTLRWLELSEIIS
jgi:ATP-binding cassette subfamily F protein uup